MTKTYYLHGNSVPLTLRILCCRNIKKIAKIQNKIRFPVFLRLPCNTWHNPQRGMGLFLYQKADSFFFFFCTP
ncbi:hypothetical protein GDO81_002546 [Engystomops pustulosus]|uniref:Uncharacterized protein n=1 Tax=Engystomops pustulosus TaxID=76066 RepID=A0AAV7DL55_ENGPU|nr:hypothetical protein GDO81_002546 [Engystomops pustulosus]